MNDRFPTFNYMCKCREGFTSSRGTYVAVVNQHALEVCNGGFNLAGGKPTDQSDTSGDAASSRAVDGNIDPQFFTGNTCSSTTSHANAWWRVDLGQLEFVAHVFIQFMDGCCDPNATHFLIEAGPYLEDHFPVAGQEFQNYVCSSFSVADISDHSGLHVHCGRSIAARYVYIRQQENNNLTLCEVYVYDEPNDNIALGQPDYTLAVDGNLQTCHTTASILDPFLRIDLGFVRPVALVHIVSEVNMTDVAVVVGEELTGEQCSSSDGNVYANVLKEYVCDHPDRINGRYVFVTIRANKTASLNLCEVEVFAVYEYDLTWMGSATQSSSALTEMNADLGFDNDRFTCTATAEETDPWWKIDLGTNYTITEITIYLASENFIPRSSQYEVNVDQQLCGNFSTTNRQFVLVSCSPKAHGQVIEITSIGANKRVALCEVEVYSEVRIAYDDTCNSSYVCSSDQVCNNTSGFYTCKCIHPGFEFDPAVTLNYPSKECVDIDECQNSSACRSDYVCNNTVGSYRCECRLGYVEDPSSQNVMEPICVDMDECQYSSACRSELICNNTVGSYRCECPLGYVEDPNSQNMIDPICLDYDECQSASACRSDHVCKNTVGSYRCECPLGYVEDPSSQNVMEPICVDMDECQSSSACRSDLVCNNTVGSYRCECSLGYVEDPSSQNVTDPLCVDVDECVNSVESLGCSPFSNCVNFVGSFLCACKDGYLGDGRTCQERAVVFEMVCQNRGGLVQMCDANGDYKCKCDRGTVYDSQTKTCRPTG